MKKIKIEVSTNIVNSKVIKFVDVDDECTEEEIEEIVNESVWEMIYVSWEANK